MLCINTPLSYTLSLSHTHTDIHSHHTRGTLIIDGSFTFISQQLAAPLPRFSLLKLVDNFMVLEFFHRVESRPMEKCVKRNIHKLLHLMNYLRNAFEANKCQLEFRINDNCLKYTTIILSQCFCCFLLFLP